MDKSTGQKRFDDLSVQYWLLAHGWLVTNKIVTLANSEDLDQTPQKEASDQDLHC